MLAAVLFLGCFAGDLPAQNLTPSALHKPTPKPSPKPKTSASSPKKKPAEDDPLKEAVGGSGLAPGTVITTEIYAEQAFFDSANHIGIFTGHVIVNDPRFNVQSDKLTIYLNKNQDITQPAAAPSPKAEPGAAAEPPEQALEKAVAEGNVGVVRERPDDNGGPPVRSVGRSDMAIYTTNDGNVELRGTPRVQSGLNMHIATSPDTVMVMNQNGQLVTRGPSRTEIKQEPKPSPSPSPAPATPKP